MATKNHGGRRKGASPPRKMLKSVKTTLDQEESDYKEMQRRYGRDWQQVTRNLIAVHLATETEAKQPIQGHLLRESGWVKQDDGGATDWYNKSLDEVDENRDPCADPSCYYLQVLYGKDDEILVYIVMEPGGGRHVPGIETMEQLERLYNILWQGEKDA